VEEPKPKIVFASAKKKKDMKTLQPIIQALISLVTVIVAALAVWVSYQTYLSTSEDRALQREAAVVAQERQELADRNNRFTYAIEHLRDESLAIRMGALFELRKLGLEDEKLQVDIVRIIHPLIQKGIETQEFLVPSNHYYVDLLQPKDDIFLTCEIISWFSNPTAQNISLNKLQAENIDLALIQLRHASLQYANFRGAYLELADLSGAYLRFADFHGAYLKDTDLNGANLGCVDFEEADLIYADLRGAKELIPEQLLNAKNVEKALLDPDLRAEYDRLKAEQDAASAS